ncbi:competence protein ComN [Jeotgalibacillus sp. S-D1]|uniref:post-transcriptional regulator n=1 Tax=Jeotgalibacillus sp. S-D1 TaxID=2552189 RepID=UPI00105A827F|nr:post-transcriptional regulator [Jeotgalibacillus sp. S-D1]TDL34436.1 competence protein ComN [Jeotgalibacillus sp. S-D1]
MDKHSSLKEEYWRLGAALESKVEELHFYGYDTATLEGLWSYLVNKKWKKHEGEIPLYMAVNDILTIKSGDFMNYTTRTEYKSSSSNLKMEDQDLQMLLHGHSEEDKTPSEK